MGIADLFFSHRVFLVVKRVRGIGLSCVESSTWNSRRASQWVVKHGTYNLSVITFYVAFLCLGIASASVIDRGKS